MQAFRACGADYMPETQVWQIEEGWNLFLTSGGNARRIARASFCSRMAPRKGRAPFPGWTLPGVMTVGAAQILLKSGGMLRKATYGLQAPGRCRCFMRPQLSSQRTYRRFPRYVAQAGLAALTKLTGAWRRYSRLVEGSTLVSRFAQERQDGAGFHDLRAGAMAAAISGHGSRAGERRKVKADILLVHEGVVPRIHETMALGCAMNGMSCRTISLPQLDGWGESSKAGLFVAGDAGGIGGLAGSDAVRRNRGTWIAKHLDASFDAGR
ncbi:hypothetical protein F2981_32860 (plasmid) [Sinorhizobium meliloti]|nr:hypothetical protein [Sinorhizobium meliloti]